MTYVPIKFRMMGIGGSAINHDFPIPIDERRNPIDPRSFTELTYTDTRPYLPPPNYGDLLLREHEQKEAALAMAALHMQQRERDFWAHPMTDASGLLSAPKKVKYIAPLTEDEKIERLAEIAIQNSYRQKEIKQRTSPSEWIKRRDGYLERALTPIEILMEQMDRAAEDEQRREVRDWVEFADQQVRNVRGTGRLQKWEVVQTPTRETPIKILFRYNTILGDSETLTFDLSGRTETHNGPTGTSIKSLDDNSKRIRFYPKNIPDNCPPHIVPGSPAHLIYNWWKKRK